MNAKNATWPRWFLSGAGIDKLKKKQCTCIGEDDIGDCSKALVKACLDRGIHSPITGSFHTNANHGDHYGREDGDEAHNSHVADLLQRPRKREHETNNHPNNTKHNRASSVRCDRVHHDGERENVAAHDEDQEQNLGSAEYFSPD